MTKNWNSPIYCSRKNWDPFSISGQNLKRSHILPPQNLRPFWHVSSKFETVPYFAAVKFETVSPSQKSNPTSRQNLKRSHILQPQNLRPFHHVTSNIETVPYFAATKSETVSPRQNKIWTGPIFCGCNFRDLFAKIEMVAYFAVAFLA